MSEKQMTIEIGGKSYETNGDGFLRNSADWDETWVAYHEERYAEELKLIRGNLHCCYNSGFNEWGIYPNTLIQKVRERTLKDEGVFKWCVWCLIFIYMNDQEELAEVLARTVGATKFDLFSQS